MRTCMRVSAGVAVGVQGGWVGAIAWCNRSNRWWCGNAAATNECLAYVEKTVTEKYESQECVSQGSAAWCDRVTRSSVTQRR